MALQCRLALSTLAGFALIPLAVMPLSDFELCRAVPRHLPQPPHGVNPSLVPSA